MSKQLNALLDKAVKALPAKSPVRIEIEAAMEKRAEFTARAKAAWATMRAPGGVHFEAPVEPVKPVKGKRVAKAPAKTGPAPKTTGKRAPAAPATH